MIAWLGMSLRQSVTNLWETPNVPTFTENKSAADYVARILRQEHGVAIRQEKLCSGGWHLMISEAALRRRHRRHRHRASC